MWLLNAVDCMTNLKEEFKEMQLRLTWLVLVIFAVGIMSISIVGCGGDTEEEAPDKTTASTSTTATTEEPAVAARPPIDFAVEKAAIQEVYSAFYAAFNDEDLKGIQATVDTASIVFGTIFAGNEPVPLAIGWKNVEIGIKGLWIGIGTKGAKWGRDNQLKDVWIRYKGSKLEASAIGLNCYKGSFPGETHLYLMKDPKDGWKIHEIDSITENNLGIFGLYKGKARLKDEGNFFTTEKDKAP